MSYRNGPVVKIGENSTRSPFLSPKNPLAVSEQCSRVRVFVSLWNEGGTETYTEKIHEASFMPKILGGVGAHEILHFDLGLGLKTYPCYSALHNLHI